MANRVMANRVMTNSKAPYLAKPERPAPEECCGGGCVPCVYDYYYAAMEEWQAMQEDLANATSTQETKENSLERNNSRK